MTTVKGVLDRFFETGTEGIVWSVYEDGMTGYDGLNCLSTGDHLTIFDPDNRDNIVWYGNIDLEYETNTRPIPTNPQYSKQAVAGMWVNGLQRGVGADEWNTWFAKAYPCELIKADLRQFFHVKSSLVNSYACNLSCKDEPSDLYIQFKDITIYKYKDVPYSTLYTLTTTVESFGKYFLSNIKDKFVAEKVELPKPDWDFIPIMSGGKFPKVKP